MESTEPTSQKSNRTLPTVLAGVVIAALISGGGVYAYQHSQQTKSQQSLQAQIDSLNSQLALEKQSLATAIPTITASPIIAVTASPSASATPDPTAGWQTYTDTTDGVSFKYPTTWTASKSSNTINFQSPEAQAAAKSGVPDYQADSMAVYYYASAKDLTSGSNSSTLEDWLTSQKGTPSVQSYTLTKMPLVNYGSYSVYSVENSLPNTTYYVEISSKVFDFVNGSGTLSAIDQNILESIQVTP